MAHEKLPLSGPRRRFLHEMRQPPHRSSPTRRMAGFPEKIFFLSSTYATHGSVWVRPQIRD
jgi:hypothetical protein